MKTIDDHDPWKVLLCAILKRAMDDAVADTRERKWLDSEDARMLCEMADVNYERFKERVEKKIDGVE